MRSAILAISVLLISSRALPAQDTKEILAGVKKLGGNFRIDEKAAGKPVVMIDLSNTEATDDDLARLKEFTRLEELLLRRTAITDAGLVHLKGFANLRELDLAKTKITDAGLAN